jgi:hypothetical protein
LTFAELGQRNELLAQERDTITHERDAIARERDVIARDLDREREHAAKLAARLKELGVEIVD